LFRDTEYKDETQVLLVLQLQIQISTLEGAVQGGVVGVLSNSNPNDPSDITPSLHLQMMLCKIRSGGCW
jgi:hypothetical protein